jgi:hypothetical protein
MNTLSHGTDTCRYGDDKGACENIFSYGFLEDAATSARVMFLDLDIPDDDPLRPAKIYVSTAAPGFRMFDKDNTVDWESDFIWLIVVNEEDGLDFKIRQTMDGMREIQAFWKERELDTVKLREYLAEDPAWDVFQLRATVLLQNRVDAQIEKLREREGAKREATVRDTPWRLAERLRSLELDMLERAASAFDSQVRPASFFSYSTCRVLSSESRTTTAASDGLPMYTSKVHEVPASHHVRQVVPYDGNGSGAWRNDKRSKQ